MFSIAPKVFGAVTGLALAVLGSRQEALAANIAAAIGVPGTPVWQAACLAANPTIPPQVPRGTSGLADCGGPDPACLHRVEVDQVEFPNARFADGTRPVFYVRPGVGADANRWLVYLKGGGACSDEATCHARWCGQQGDLPYTANMMSADWNADGTIDLVAHGRSPGITARTPENRFANWSIVYVYYASADSHRGRMNDVAMGSFTVDARGHTNLFAIRNMLRKLNANPAWAAAGGFVMPDLDSATDITVAGESAGGKGAVFNADWFLSVFPGARGSLVIDANGDVSDAVITANDIWADTNNDGVGDVRYVDYRPTWFGTGYDVAIDSFYDESCRAIYEPLGRLDRCHVIAQPLLDQVSTPTFMRLDLADQVKSGEWVDHPNDRGFGVLIGGQNGRPVDRNDYAKLIRASHVGAYTDHTPVTGLFAPRCGDHVGLTDASVFTATLGPDTDEAFSPPALVFGSHVSYHDALWTWHNIGAANRADIRRLDTDAPNQHFSSCGSVADFARWLDLKCYVPDANARNQDLNRDIGLRHLNPVLASAPDHVVRVRRLQELCVPVSKNDTLPPDNIVDLERFADFACYEIENGPPLNRRLRLDHINPVIMGYNPPLPTEVVDVGVARQLCVAVAKNLPTNPIPPRVAELLRHLDLECFDIAGPPIVGLQPPLRLGHMNPLLTGFPDELVSNLAPRSLCVPVYKQGNPTPPAAILDLISRVDIKKYDFGPVGPALNVNLWLRQINPLLAGVPDVHVATLTPRSLGLPVSKQAVARGVPALGTGARAALGAALLIAFVGVATRKRRRSVKTS